MLGRKSKRLVEKQTTRQHSAEAGGVTKASRRKAKEQRVGGEEAVTSLPQLQQSSRTGQQHRGMNRDDELQEEVQEVIWQFDESVSETAKNTMKRLAFPKSDSKYAVHEGLSVNQVLATVNSLPMDSRGSFYCALLSDGQYHLIPASILRKFAPQDMVEFLEKALLNHIRKKQH